MYHSFPEKLIVTKKPHSCWGCCKKIEKGETVLKQSGVHEGEGFWNGWFCLKCASFLKNKSSFDWEDYPDGLEQGCFPEHDDFKDHETKPIQIYIRPKY